MNFKAIPGHSDVKASLRALADSGRVPHALMLSGPPGVGKMMLARAFAQYLHCEHPENGEPCGRCRSCLQHQQLEHPDMHWSFPIVKNKSRGQALSSDMAPQWAKMLAEYPAMPFEQWLDIIEAGNSQPAIHVEEAADIIARDAYPSYSSKHKIFVIWLPERLRPEAANKLLKVIEEPSEGSVFILVSDNDLQVLPTIFSRVRKIPVGALSERQIEDYLVEKYHLDPSRAMAYARLCEGSLAQADALGSNSGDREEFLGIYQEVMRAAYAARVMTLRRLAEKIAAFGREKTCRYLSYTAQMLRENFIYNLGRIDLNAMTPEEGDFSVRFAPFVNHKNIEDFLAETDRVKRDIERNANSKIALFDYFLITTTLLRRKS